MTDNHVVFGGSTDDGSRPDVKRNSGREPAGNPGFTNALPAGGRQGWVLQPVAVDPEKTENRGEDRILVWCPRHELNVRPAV